MSVTVGRIDHSEMAGGKVLVVGHTRWRVELTIRKPTRVGYREEFFELEPDEVPRLKELLDLALGRVEKQ